MHQLTLETSHKQHYLPCLLQNSELQCGTLSMNHVVDETLTLSSSGGGIGGLISAIAISKFSLQNKDIHIDLYEGAQAFFEIGAGVTAFRRPWLILKDIGLETALRSITKVPIEEDKAGMNSNQLCAFMKYNWPYFS